MRLCDIRDNYVRAVWKKGKITTWHAETAWFFSNSFISKNLSPFLGWSKVMKPSLKSPRSLSVPGEKPEEGAAARAQDTAVLLWPARCCALKSTQETRSRRPPWSPESCLRNGASFPKGLRVKNIYAWNTAQQVFLAQTGHGWMERTVPEKEGGCIFEWNFPTS